MRRLTLSRSPLSGYSEGMDEIEQHRDSLGEVSYPPVVEEALKEVSELPDDPEQQAEFFDKVQNALTSRLRDES